MTFPLKTVGVFAGLLFVAALQFFVFTPSANAAISDGGTPSGGGGSYYTTYGFGWYSYDINSGTGPEAWSAGGPWATVQAQCRAEGAQRVDAFIIQRSGGNDSGNRAKVYRWEAGGYSTGWPGYKGNNGGNWMSVATAQAHFNTISASQRAGYTFGSNVAWFCYNPINFNLTPTITGTPRDIDGSTNDVTLTPVVKNTGSTTSSSVAWQVSTFRLPPSVTTTPVAGQGGTAPNTYYGNGATTVASGSSGFGVGDTNLKNSIAKQSIGDFPVGTRICYALSVRPYSHTTSDWRYSAPYCIVVSKKPKIQVIGSDVLVGRAFAGQASRVSTIQTGITNQAEKTETIPAPASAFSGLYNTGVNDAGRKLGSDQPDPHWNLARIIRNTPTPANTCQRGINASGQLVAIPTTGTTGIPGRTIYENGSSAGYTVAAPNATIGDQTPGGVNDNAGNSPWARVSTKARWISQNSWGQNYSTRACQDPTYPPNHQNINRANIYVFRLKNGFTIDPAAKVDLSSLRLRIAGGVDNGVRFVVNGQYVDSGWQYPGWSAGATATSDVTGTNIFKNGVNTLEIYVISNYSHTGLMIEDISITGTAQRKIANMYGSWAEYAVAATGGVQGLASASGFAGGVVTTTDCAVALLTLANTANPSPSRCQSAGDLGKFDTKRTIPDVASRFQTGSSTPKLTGSIDLEGSNRQGLYTADTDITLTGTTLGKGRWVVINAGNRTVNITGNITYTNGVLNAPGDIPQLVIIAGRINIYRDVERIDAWLVASGTEGVINTCRTQPVGTSGTDYVNLSADICEKALTVNGPVMAKKLVLNRTKGADEGRGAGTPAEIFNLRPDAYIWAATRASTTGRIQTVYTQELPPRF